MITHVELWPAGGSGEPAWTLVYTYRTFVNASGIRALSSGSGCASADAMSVLNPLHAWDAYSLEPALHSVVAYRGSVDLSERDHILMAHPMSDGPAATPAFVDIREDQGSVCRVFTEPVRGGYDTPLDYQDAVIGPTGEGEPGAMTSLPNDWVHIAEYSYSEPEFFSSDQHAPPYRPADNYFAAATGEMRDESYYELEAADRIRSLDYSLLRVVSSRRIDSQDPGNFSSVPRYWLYRYQDIHEGMNSGAERIFGADGGEFVPYGDFNTQAIIVDLAESQQFPRRLKSRFGPKTVARLLAGWEAQKDDPGVETTWFSGAASDRAYLNGLISAADWTSIAWAVNQAAIGSLSPWNPTLVPIDAVPLPSGDSSGGGGSEPGGGGGPSDDPEQYRMLALHHLADATYLGWNQQYRFAMPGNPAGVATTDWTPEGGSGMRWHRDLAANPIPEGGEVASLTSWADYWATGTSGSPCYDTEDSGGATQSGGSPGYRANLRENYLGKQFAGDTGTIAEERRVGFLPGGASVFIEGAAGSAVYRRVYRFVQTPSDSAWIGTNHPDGDFVQYPGPEVIQDPFGDGNCAPNFACSRALYKYPYRFTSSANLNGTAYHSDYGDYPSNAQEFTPSPPPGQRSLGEVMWWTVIDEFPTYEDLTTAWETPGEEKWTSRRIVGLSPAGRILHDQTWTDDGLEDSRGILSLSYEYDTEGRVVAERSRGWAATLAEQDEQVKFSRGLITTFAYDDPEREALCADFNFSGTAFPGLFDELGFLIPDAWRLCAESIGHDPSVNPGTEIKTVSIKEGLEGTEHALTDLEWDEQDNVTLDRRFGLGVPADDISVGSPLLSETATTYEYYPPGDDPGDPEDRTVRKKLAAGAPIVVRPAGIPVRPFECEMFDEGGRRIWRVYGLKEDVSSAAPNASNPDETIFVDYTQYDDIGRVVLDIRDIKFDAGAPVIELVHTRTQDNITTTTFLNGDIDLLGGFERKHPSAPLNEATLSRYNDYGRIFLLEPNGLRTLTAWTEFEGILVELQARGVSVDGGGNATIGSGSASDYRGGQLSETRSFAVDDQSIAYQLSDANAIASLLKGVLGEDGHGGDRTSLLSTLEPSYDSSGRLSGLGVTTPDRPGENLEGLIFKNGWGQLVRSENPDGDIARHTYDDLGRLFKTFRGTSDHHPAWRGVTDPLGDDMVLTERLFYGTEISDASLPIHRWTFNTVSPDQYGEDVHERSEGDPAGLWVPALAAENTAVSPGQREDLFYDWRMRKIGTMLSQLGHYDPDTQTSIANATRTEITWLDNADRVRFRAVYDGDATAVLVHSDGPDTRPGDTLPDAGAILAIDPGAGSTLVSLDETIYSAAGHVQETRRYNAESSDPSYMFTQTYADHDGRPVWSRSGREITENIYNAKGQLIETRRHATMPGSHDPAVEISRTVNVYDAVTGLLLTTETRERLGETDTNGFPVSAPLGSLPGLDADGPAVFSTRTDHWYDDQQRIVVTAEYGNASPSNRLDGPSSFPERPESIDRLFHEIASAAGSDERWLSGYVYPGSPASAWFDDHGRAIAMITCHDYDGRGKLRSTFRTTECYTDGVAVNTAGTSTWTRHSGHGQKDLELTFAYEFVDNGNPSEPTVPPHGTAYAYSGARLTKIASVMPDHFDPSFDATVVPEVDWTRTDGTLRITEVEYNAPIIDAADSPADFFAGSAQALSTRPDLVSAVYRPDPTTGQPSAAPAYRFVYRVNGALAGRQDARGVTLEHAYDDEDRLAAITAEIPTGGSLPAYELLPPDTSTHPFRGVRFTRDERGRLVAAEMLDENGSYNGWSRTEFHHDSWGNLTSEIQTQGLGALAHQGGVSRSVDYTWAVGPTSDAASPGSNTSRLESIAYPAWLGGTWDSSASPPRRVVHYRYGPAGHLDDAIDRVASISSTGGSVELGHIASYTYHGRSRLVATALGDPGVDIDNDPATPHAFMRETLDLDRHGRLGEQAFEGYDSGWLPDPIFEAVHGHDEAGRRLFTRLRQADIETPGDRDNIRSWLYEYDTFGRLTGALQGTLPDEHLPLPGNTNLFANPAFTIAPADAYELAFRLDRHGNRIGSGDGNDLPGFYEGFGDTDADGQTDPIFTYTISTDFRDRLASRTDTGTAPVDPAGYVYDAAGNLTADGRFLFHYDALSRLVAVEDTALPDDPADPDGRLVLSFAYDPLGRLIHRLSPWEAGSSETRIELFWYDGARRIQDVVIDPYPVSIPGLTLQQIDPLGGGGQAERRLEGETIYAAHSGAAVDRAHVVVDWWERDAWLLS
jgi:YD repeat-containing protein